MDLDFRLSVITSLILREVIFFIKLFVFSKKITTFANATSQVRCLVKSKKMSKDKSEAIVLVDENGEIINPNQLPEFLRPIQAGATVYAGEPIDVRAMLKDHSGHFSIKGLTNEGRSIEGFLVNSRTIEGIRPSASYERPATFTQHIMFGRVGSIKTFFCVTYGGVSAATAKEYPTMLQIAGGAISNIVSANIEDATNDKKQKFGIARFKHRLATQAEIMEFMQAFRNWPDAVNKFGNIPNIDANA